MNTHIFGGCTAVFQSQTGPIVNAVFNDVPVECIPASLEQRQSGETVMLHGSVGDAEVSAIAYCGSTPGTFRRVVASFHAETAFSDLH